MKKDFSKLLQGYQRFRNKYVHGSKSVMKQLADDGQKPEIMIVACSDSRVDPALILQCEPGDLFVVRNVANIVPPYEKDKGHHGVSAALEFGVNVLGVKHLIILGHSQCGGIQALMQGDDKNSDFLQNWLAIIDREGMNKNSRQTRKDINVATKLALQQSYEHCMQFPWIAKKVEQKSLAVHVWFFDIFKGKIFVYNRMKQQYRLLHGKK